HPHSRARREEICDNLSASTGVSRVLEIVQEGKSVGGGVKNAIDVLQRVKGGPFDIHSHTSTFLSGSVASSTNSKNKRHPLGVARKDGRLNLETENKSEHTDDAGGVSITVGSQTVLVTEKDRAVDLVPDEDIINGTVSQHSLHYWGTSPFCSLTVASGGDVTLQGQRVLFEETVETMENVIEHVASVVEMETARRDVMMSKKRQVVAHIEREKKLRSMRDCRLADVSDSESSDDADGLSDEERHKLDVEQDDDVIQTILKMLFFCFQQEEASWCSKSKACQSFYNCSAGCIDHRNISQLEQECVRVCDLQSSFGCSLQRSYVHTHSILNSKNSILSEILSRDSHSIRSYLSADIDGLEISKDDSSFVDGEHEIELKCNPEIGAGVCSVMDSIRVCEEYLLEQVVPSPIPELAIGVTPEFGSMALRACVSDFVWKGACGTKMPVHRNELSKTCHSCSSSSRAKSQSTEELFCIPDSIPFEIPLSFCLDHMPETSSSASVRDEIETHKMRKEREDRVSSQDSSDKLMNKVQEKQQQLSDSSSSSSSPQNPRSSSSSSSSSTSVAAGAASTPRVHVNQWDGSEKELPIHISVWMHCLNFIHAQSSLFLDNALIRQMYEWLERLHLVLGYPLVSIDTFNICGFIYDFVEEKLSKSSGSYGRKITSTRRGDGEKVLPLFWDFSEKLLSHTATGSLLLHTHILSAYLARAVCECVSGSLRIASLSVNEFYHTLVSTQSTNVLSHIDVTKLQKRYQRSNPNLEVILKEAMATALATFNIAAEGASPVEIVSRTIHSSVAVLSDSARVFAQKCVYARVCRRLGRFVCSGSSTKLTVTPITPHTAPLSELMSELSTLPVSPSGELLKPLAVPSLLAILSYDIGEDTETMLELFLEIHTTLLSIVELNAIKTLSLLHLKIRRHVPNVNDIDSEWQDEHLREVELDNQMKRNHRMLIRSDVEFATYATARASNKDGSASTIAGSTSRSPTLSMPSSIVPKFTVGSSNASLCMWGELTHARSNPDPTILVPTLDHELSKLFPISAHSKPTLTTLLTTIHDTLQKECMRFFVILQNTHKHMLDHIIVRTHTVSQRGVHNSHLSEASGLVRSWRRGLHGKKGGLHIGRCVRDRLPVGHPYSISRILPSSLSIGVCENILGYHYDPFCIFSHLLEHSLLLPPHCLQALSSCATLCELTDHVEERSGLEKLQMCVDFEESTKTWLRWWVHGAQELDSAELSSRAQSKDRADERKERDLEREDFS
ncbi:hypothetical protein ADUPG1_009112, partial [Aduncisulcus paluster]